MVHSQVPDEHAWVEEPEQKPARKSISAPRAHASSIAVDLEVLVGVLRKLRPGRTGGSDGVTAEFLGALDLDSKARLAAQVRLVLEGSAPCPPRWRVAEVALIPKMAGASVPGALCPISGLPVLLKVTMRCWLHLAEPYLRLRRPPSDGFRPGFQAAEAHWAIRALMQKHREFGMKVVVSKLDMFKAYDTLRWDAIEASFERRGMPSGAVQFAVVPRQGIPQGAPEGPAVYATVMEDLNMGAEAALLAAGRPAGLRLRPDEDMRRLKL